MISFLKFMFDIVDLESCYIAIGLSFELPCCLHLFRYECTVII